MNDFTFWYTALMLVAMTVCLVKEWFGPELVIFSTLLMMILGRVIHIEDALHGFSNQGMLTVGFLFIVASALGKTGYLNRMGTLLLGKKGSIATKLLRLLFPVAAVSAFFNNTPIVAMLIPAIRSWSKKHDYSISKFLIPLSYASILGGICTLIGTSTNLVVHGLMIENGMEGFSLFEISKVGIPLACIGLLTIALVGQRILPDRKEPLVNLGEHMREFVVAMKVGPGFKAVGKSVEAAGLRHLKGLFLFQIERNNNILTPVSPDMRLSEGDRLFFTGLPETIIELQKMPGLVIMKDVDIDLKNYDSDQLKTFEAVVSKHSPLVSKNVRESHFRSRYDAVILAIHRSGERIKKKIGDVVLQPGDTLLILSGRNFLEHYYHSKDFYLVSRSADIPSKPQKRALGALAILGAMILMMALNVFPIVLVVSLAALILVLTRFVSPEEAKRSVDWSVLLIIASSFGIAKALENSGIAFFLANRVIAVFGSLGTVGLIAGIYFMTSLYTEIITNNAAAALIFPIALSLTNQLGIDPRPFLVTVAVAASASFATPIGYQTNLMVYGPGGYRFTDFLKIGIPMNLFIGLLATVFIAWIYF